MIETLLGGLLGGFRRPLRLGFRFRPALAGHGGSGKLHGWGGGARSARRSLWPCRLWLPRLRIGPAHFRNDFLHAFFMMVFRVQDGRFLIFFFWF